MSSHNHDLPGIPVASNQTGTGFTPSMAMPMYFNWQLPAYLLFYEWAPRRQSDLIWSGFATLGIALLLEMSKGFRLVIGRWDTQRVGALLKEHPGFTIVDVRVCFRLMFRRWHVLETILHGGEMVLSYFLMLIAMSFNVWLFVAMTGGTVVGYYITAPLTEKKEIKSCLPVSRCKSGTEPCAFCGRICGDKCEQNCDITCL